MAQLTINVHRQQVILFYKEGGPKKRVKKDSIF